MTEARCALVREIEHMARSTHHGSVTRLNDIISARGIINNPRWPRIRAALEAAEEMAAHAPCAIAAPSLWEAAKRYRDAVGGECNCAPFDNTGGGHYASCPAATRGVGT